MFKEENSLLTLISAKILNNRQILLVSWSNDSSVDTLLLSNFPLQNYSGERTRTKSYFLLTLLDRINLFLLYFVVHSFEGSKTSSATKPDFFGCSVFSRPSPNIGSSSPSAITYANSLSRSVFFFKAGKFQRAYIGFNL